MLASAPRPEAFTVVSAVSMRSSADPYALVSSRFLTAAFRMARAIINATTEATARQPAVTSSIGRSIQAMMTTHPTVVNPAVMIWANDEDSATRATEVSATVYHVPVLQLLEARIRACRRRPVRVVRRSSTMFSPARPSR